MFKIIKDKSNYEIIPKLKTSIFKDVEVNLFGNKYYFRDDYYMKHIHIKITDRCNAKCDFCIEKDSNIKENKENMLENLESLLEQMNNQNHLNTVSITGGEPTLCSYLQEILNIVSKYDVFLSMNTNGRSIREINNAPKWINISKHDIDDSKIFLLPTLEKKDIYSIKENTNAKIRFQSVLIKNHLDSVNKIISFFMEYKDIVDDFSFRQLIRTKDLDLTEPTLIELKKYLFNNANLIEQVFQDYYVYEIWEYFGKTITLSFADMELLQKAEKTEPKNILREIIIHPDGLISGDWNRKNKIIKK